MLVIDNTLISIDLLTEKFVCNLEKCLGACCFYGDSGAPLESDELSKIEDAYKASLEYITEKGRISIEEQGCFLTDNDGDFVTPLIAGKECAYSFVDNGIYKCAIEKAFLEGKTDFRKPISCYLYPVRIKKLPEYIGVNYDRWDICESACKYGKELKIPVYKFLKEPLIAKFGEEWYKQLEYAAENIHSK